MSASASASTTATGASPTASATVLRDDFDRLDRSVWSVNHYGCFAPGNVSVSGGLLRLRTVATSSTECPLVGGRIDTIGKQTFPAGTFSARIKFAPRTGSWQTFWLTGANGRRFPHNGEVDIAEILGRESQVHHLRLHSAFRDGSDGKCSQVADLPQSVGYLGGWHVYSVTTGPTRVDFGVDGRVVQSYTRNGFCSWPFGDPMRVILSAHGGTYGGPPDKSLFPATMLVDWASWSGG